ncbi:YbgA family protein [Vibrio amylolyticus]|uniref:YbgA family protein n=1 Tax=Vibrio amylolyticus TaxID=2847292 RepID=UPI00354C6257
MKNKLQIGISACVTGQQVRYDKSHKRSSFCMDELSEFVEFKPVCPEMAVGLPTPRPTIRQISVNDVIKVSRPDGSSDVTDAMTEFGQSHAKSNPQLAGFIFCAKSPSCGMERVKVYQEDGKGSVSNGIGLFAEQIMKNNPLLPCEENGRLNDQVIRENFITRIFTYQKWLDLCQEGITLHKLIEFHSSHKYLVMTHNIQRYKALGKLLADPKDSIDVVAENYISMLMETLTIKATRRGHTNTLQHLQGYFKKQLCAQRREELTQEIESYRLGLTPLLVPLTLIKHYMLEYPNDYLERQVYLSPHPKALRLRYGY